MRCFGLRPATAGGLRYWIDVWDGSGAWVPNAVGDVEIRRTPRYDGTATRDVTCRLRMPIDESDASGELVRVRVSRQ